MKFNELLEEGTIKLTKMIEQAILESAKTILSTKDFPDWVKKVFRDNGLSYGTISVEANPEPFIGGQLYDADVMTVYFYANGEVIKQHSASYDTLMNSDKKEKAIYKGGTIRLWDEPVPGKPNMILVTHTYPKKAELFVHPKQMPKQISSEKTDLSDDEKKVLLITKAYTSAYRKEYFKRYDVLNNLDKIREKLISKKLLTAAGALNIAGKNVIEQLTDGGAASSTIEKLFGFK